MDASIPEKANRVLNFILLALLLILLRVWYLSTIQREEHVEKARRPQRREVIERVERASIHDRFNIPLAINKVQYNAAVCYADIRQIPSTKWEINTEGKRVRIPARAHYIRKLAALLGQELQMDPQQIEDTIHGKASLFPHTPFVLKEGITEEQYYRLKMLELDWVGISTERGSKRFYPLGKTAADVLGYLGAISSKEYYQIAQEIRILQQYLSDRESNQLPLLPKGFNNPLEVRERLKALQERAYTINVLIGKSGIEGAFDADLRGYAGKKIYEVDRRGNPLRLLPGERKSIPGQRINLSLSAELQAYAEELLTIHEHMREVRHPDGQIDWSAPWIKGGAIVAMDPKTGEILALASYPRLDPNDFTDRSKQLEVVKWLENERYIEEVWEGRRPLERERWNVKDRTFFTESAFLTFDNYLQSILPPQHPLFLTFQNLSTVQEILLFQKSIETQHIDIETAPVLKHVTHPKDKLLFLDLCRMLVHHELFDLELQNAIGNLSLKDYHRCMQAAANLHYFLLGQCKEWYRQIDFQRWRETHFKNYLKQKRQEEKEKKHYVRPYTDYLTPLERGMFRGFFEKESSHLMLSLITNTPPQAHHLLPYWEKLCTLSAIPVEIRQHIQILKTLTSSLPTHLKIPFLQTLRPFQELKRPLLGNYPALRKAQGVQLEKHLAAAFYPVGGYGYGRSQAFRQSAPQGSVFKLVVAYQGLLERFLQIKDDCASFAMLNPLTLIDSMQWHKEYGSSAQILGYTLEGQPIPRLYKGGKLPRSHPNIGKVDLIGALEQSSNLYFSILSGEYLKDPLELIHTARRFGFGEKTGIELAGEFEGSLPNDLKHNKTGLYAFGIGQHSLVVTPLQTAVMLSAIANQGDVLKPKIVHLITGQEPIYDESHALSPRSFPFQEGLALLGIHFPVFTATIEENSTPCMWYQTPEIKHHLFLPPGLRMPLIEGMRRVVQGQKGLARPEIIRAFHYNPIWKKNYLQLQNQLIGKTGTAEILYKQSIDAATKAKIHNHIWFGAIAFADQEPQRFDSPELTVVVYLRFSESGGKEAAPLAAEMVKKWREIRAKHVLYTEHVSK